jgi:hypothetical protein
MGLAAAPEHADAVLARDGALVLLPVRVRDAKARLTWKDGVACRVALSRTFYSSERRGAAAMPTYEMVYGDSEQVVRETFDDVEVQREDGWVVLFRGPDAILRVREEHVQSLEAVEQT